MNIKITFDPPIYNGWKLTADLFLSSKVKPGKEDA
jgi:hypothetical protein